MKSVERIVNARAWKTRVCKWKLKSTRLNKWYNYISLYKNNIPWTKKIHRLVAQAFIPNPENKPCINHINWIKDDNRVENLEWCTYSENSIHAIQSWLNKPRLWSDNKLSKKVIQLTKDWKEIKIFWSVREAWRMLWLSSWCITNVCNKIPKYHSVWGYIFKYID